MKTLINYLLVLCLLVTVGSCNRLMRLEPQSNEEKMALTACEEGCRDDYDPCAAGCTYDEDGTCRWGCEQVYLKCYRNCESAVRDRRTGPGDLNKN